MNKSGVTLISMVIYVVLFFSFSVFAVGMSMNMEYKTLSEKGKVYVNEQNEKLQYNLVKSSKGSEYFDVIGEKILFSNKDEYEYNKDKKVVLKNGGALVTNVEEFKILNYFDLENKPKDFVNSVDNNIDSVLIQVKYTKYKEEKVAQIFITSGGDLIE